MSKRAEAEFAASINEIPGIYLKKFRDAMQCPRCKFLIYKTDRMVDYQLVVAGRVFLVEVKEDVSGKWSFNHETKGILSHQREILDDWLRNHNECFLFIELGKRLPLRWAWLVPWSTWKEIESRLSSVGQASLDINAKKNFRAQEILSSFELRWKGDKKWEVPQTNPFWQITNYQPGR